MTENKKQLIRYYISIGTGLPKAIKKVKAMTDEEVQKKLEEIAKHTFF